MKKKKIKVKNVSSALDKQEKVRSGAKPRLLSNGGTKIEQGWKILYENHLRVFVLNISSASKDCTKG